MNSVGMIGSPSERRRAASGSSARDAAWREVAAHAFLAGEAGEQLAVADEVHHERAGALEQDRVLVGAQNPSAVAMPMPLEAAGRTAWRHRWTPCQPTP